MLAFRGICEVSVEDGPGDIRTTFGYRTVPQKMSSASSATSP